MGQTGILYTNYFSKANESIGKRIAICRRLPAWAVKGVHYDEWNLDLAPSAELLDSYKRKEIDDEAYEKKYVAELSKNVKGLNYIRSLLDNGEDITLLCWEAPYDKYGAEQYCHRNTIRKIFINNNYLAVEIFDTKLTIEVQKALVDFMRNESVSSLVHTNDCADEVLEILSKSKKVNFYNETDTNTLFKVEVIRIFVGGSRDFANYSLMEKTVDKVILEKGWNSPRYKIIIVEGGAPGADILARYYAVYHKYEYKEMPADWDNLNVIPCVIGIRNGKEYNKLAGFIRNEDMAKIANYMVLFHMNNSPGTADDIKLAKKYGIELKYIKC